MIGYGDGTLDVTPAVLTIRADDLSKPYGADLPTLTASYAGLVNGDTSSSLATQPTLTTTATAASHVSGGPYAITASGAADADYTINFSAGSLVVAPVELTITAEDQTMVDGAPVPPLSVSYAGLVNGDTAATFAQAPNIGPTSSTTATSGSDVAGGPYTITVGGAVDPDYSIGFASGSLTVTPATATHFAISGPAGGPSGTPESFTLTAEDQFGNVATGYVGTVHFTSSDPGAILPADAALTAGTGIFSATFSTAGTFSLTAADAASPGIAATQLNVVITLEVAVRLVIVAEPPSTVVAGSDFGLTVLVEDALGNVVAGDNGAVSLILASGPSGASLGGAFAVDAVDGVATFLGLTVDRPGLGYTLLATSRSLGAATSSAFAATPETASILGTVFLDLDSTGTMVPRDPGMADRVVFIDIHGDGILRPDDPQAITDASGGYTIPGVAPGTYTLLVKVYPNDDPTGPGVGKLSVAVAAGVDAVRVNFGLQPGSSVVTRTPTPTPFDSETTPLDSVIESLYRFILHREGEPAGIANWEAKARAGQTYTQIAEQFLHSTERQADLVESYYETFLGRHSEPSGMATWMGYFKAGWTEDQVVEAFVSSPEYNADHPDSSDFVRSLYVNLLGRDAIAPEVESWTAQLTGGNLTRGEVGLKVIDSTEAYLRGIEGDYTAFLARVGEAPGIAHWQGLIEQGTLGLTDVTADFFDNPEFLERASRGL